MKKTFTLVLLCIAIKTFSQCPWSITNPNVKVIMNCGAPSAAVVFSITGSSSDLRYYITNYPAGAAFTPTSAIIFNVNPNLSGTSSQTVTVSKIGVYKYTVTNTLTSCAQNGTFEIVGEPYFELAGIAPTSSVSCDGVANIYPPVPAGCTVSINNGTLSGSNITNLCYGNLIVCIGNTTAPMCETCKSIPINAATSIEENNLDAGVSIFPNPTNGMVKCNFNSNENYDYAIRDISGKLLQEGNLDNFKNEINLSVFSNGFYFITLKNQNKALVRKIIKE